MRNEKKELLDLLNNSIINYTKDRTKKYGLLLSGGLDSSFLATLLKNNNVKFTCFFAYVEDEIPSKDLYYAKKLAEKFNLDLEIICSNKEELEKIIPKIVKIINSSSPVSVGVAIPLYLSCRRAKEKGIDIMFSGFGSDELYGGYSKFNIENIIAKRKAGLDNIYTENLFRDEAIEKHFNLKIKYPFLNKEIIDFSLKLPIDYLLTETQNKIILRKIAKEIGVIKEIYSRDKLACQYGSNADRVLRKITRKNKFKHKTEFLKSLLNENIGMLYSGGKDSNLSLWLLQEEKRNVSCLISMISENKDSYMFQKINEEILEAQANMLELPIIFQKTKGEKEKELMDLKNAIILAKKKYNLTSIASGTIKSNYQKERIKEICDSLNLRLISPLWEVEEEKEIDLLLNNGFKFIICKIAAQGLTEKHLGKIIDKKEMEEIKKLQKKYKFNIAGEGGDYETIVLDAPNFKKEIKLSFFEKKMQNEFTGEIIIKKIDL